MCEVLALKRVPQGVKAMRWKPGYKEEYWHICPDGSTITNDFWHGYTWQKLYYRGLNCFGTRKQAEQAAVKVRKLLLSLQKEN